MRGNIVSKNGPTANQITVLLQLNVSLSRGKENECSIKEVMNKKPEMCICCNHWKFYLICYLANFS